MSAAFCFSNKVQLLEYYHNSSWREHGGSPEHAVRTAFVYQINKYPVSYTHQMCIRDRANSTATAATTSRAYTVLRSTRR